MSPQACTKFGANRSSRLVDYPDAWIFDPLTPPNAPWGLEELIVLAYVHSQMNQTCVPNLVQIGPSIW